jgi:hypothetical protein
MQVARAGASWNGMNVELFEPRSHGHVSGGYLYNARLSEHAHGVRLHAISPEQATAELSALPLSSDDWLLVDSLFLDSQLLAPFLLRRQQAGCGLGCVMHALPSFVARAQHPEQLRWARPWLPSEEEVRLLTLLDIVVVPGPYVPRVLAQTGVTTP